MPGRAMRLPPWMRPRPLFLRGAHARLARERPSWGRRRRCCARAGTIGHILALESGKRLAEVEGEVRFAAEYFQWFAEEIRRPYGEMVPGDVPGRQQMVTHQAVGVALSLTPWNFPVSIQARKLAPALAAGCTVVARPSQRAPLSIVTFSRMTYRVTIALTNSRY